MTVLRMSRGDTPLFTMNIVDYVGHALDISSVQDIWFTAKYGLNDSDEDAVFQKVLSDGGIVIIDAPLGYLSIRLSPEDTDTLVDTVKLRYDVQVLDAESKVYTVDSGTLVVSPDVTRTIT